MFQGSHRLTLRRAEDLISNAFFPGGCSHLTAMLDLIRVIYAMYALRPRWQGGLEELQSIQEQRFRALLAHAKARSHFYSKRFAGLDISTCPINALPVLTKTEMMESFDDIVTNREVKKRDLENFISDEHNLGKLFRGKYGVCHTSGTQGQPAIIVQDRSALM